MKAIKQILSLVLACTVYLSILLAVELPVMAAYENTHTNTGNQRVDIIEVAKTQLGYTEGSNNYTKYGAAYGNANSQWCAYFVSWCARQAGIPTSVIRDSANAAPNASVYTNTVRGHFGIPYYDGSSYTPCSGDLFFKKDFGHVGLVYYIEGSYFYTIEGNSNSSGSSNGTSVVVNKRRIKDFYFGVPNYNDVAHVVDTSYGTNFTAYPKAKITAGNIFNANHSQIDSTSWIGTSDKCTIHEVYTDGCCKVTYPLDAGGTKTVYSKISLFNTHTHSYAGVRVYENAHPHRISQRCVDYASCGGWIWTDEYKELKTCEQCWRATFNIGASSISVKIGESKTVSASLSGCLPDSAAARSSFSPDNGVVEVTAASKQLTFTGLKAGSTNFTLTVYSDSTKSYVIGSMTIPVTVTPAAYTISYNANGGTGAPDDQTKYHGTTLTLSSTIPTRSGYTFIGWSTSSSATSASYQPGGSFTSNATTTLYAVWRKGFYGDVYQDGVLNNNDILHMNKIRLGKIEATNWEMFIGDLDGDGSITQDDIELLNSFRVGTITAFPVDSMNRKLIVNTYPQVDFCLDTKVDISGLSVLMYYPETMAAHDITDYCDIQLPSTSSTGTKTVYISFDGLNTDYTVKVTGHTYSYKVANTPTASATGSLKGSCSECSSITTVTLPKLTTTDYTYAVKTAATCTTDGIGTYTWKTATYGEHIFQVTVPATGHAYFSYVTEPDCTSNGYTTYVCLLCLLSYKDNHTKALGHTYVNGVCIRCDEEDPAGSGMGFIGDITGDGNVNMGDVAKLYAHIKGTSVLTDKNDIKRCDITSDGNVNMGDVAKLYAYIKGTSKLY